MTLRRNAPLSRGTVARCCGRHESMCTCGEAPRLKRTPLNPVNRERQQRRKDAGDVYGDYHWWIKTLPCILYDDPDHACYVGTVVGHHVVSVGAGGRDYGNEVPVCRNAHRELHDTGADTFERRHGLDLSLIAVETAERWDRERA